MGVNIFFTHVNLLTH